MLLKKMSAMCLKSLIYQSYKLQIVIDVV